MKTILYTLLLTVFAACKSGQQASNASDNFDLQKLTFHSSPCFGFCPDISMNVYDNRTVELSITKYKGKGAPGEKGTFKGKMSKKEYNTLLTYLQEINWKTIEFSKEMCCDAPIRSLILNYNGETRKFRAMFPPESTQKLFDFLRNYAENNKLPASNEPLEFEKVTE